MDAADVTALTAAFNPSALLDTFISFAPFIITIVGIVIGVALARWGVKKVTSKLARGV